MAAAKEFEIVAFASAREWRQWLARNHAASDGIWLRLFKKTSGAASVTYGEALDEALCHGWIDGQVRRRDEATFRQRFTPRRARSPWSQRNVELIARLGDEGRMHPAGLAEVERAKGDGRWEAAYAGPAGIQVPEDLAAALAASPRAAAMFEILTSQNRYAVLLRVHSAKRADTRSRRITQFVEMLARGNTVYQKNRRLTELAVNLQWSHSCRSGGGSFHYASSRRCFSPVPFSRGMGSQDAARPRRPSGPTAPVPARPRPNGSLSPRDRLWRREPMCSDRPAGRG
jgi:uncharacterized protein YdeI (YjbR/CyaY-like superfamily)